MPPELAQWPGADLCGQCGKLHPGGCPEPVTGMPPGLACPDGGLTPLGAAVERAANYLAMRGALDPDDEEWPDWALAELAAIVLEGPCGELCLVNDDDGLLNPSAAADHYEARRQHEWERAVPLWTCDCGQPYKVLPAPPGLAFYEARDDGLLGEPAGGVHLSADGRQVKKSAACRGCGRRLADTITGRLRPQQALF